MVQSRPIDPNAEAHCGSEHQPPKLKVSGRAGLAGAHLPCSHPLPRFTESSELGATSQLPEGRAGVHRRKTTCPAADREAADQVEPMLPVGWGRGGVHGATRSPMRPSGGRGVS